MKLLNIPWRKIVTVNTGSLSWPLSLLNYAMKIWHGYACLYFLLYVRIIMSLHTTMEEVIIYLSKSCYIAAKRIFGMLADMKSQAASLLQLKDLIAIIKN